MFRKVLCFLILIVLTPYTLISTGSPEHTIELPDFDRLWNYSDPAGTEQVFKEIYQEHRETAGNSYLAQLLSQIARTQGLQSKFEEGFQTLEKAAEFASEDDSLAQVRILLETGRLHNSSGNKQAARDYFIDAKDLAIEAELDLYSIDAVHMLGIIDPPDQQLVWNLQAINMAEESSDQRAKGWLGPLLNNTGWTYFDKGEYKQALELFERSLTWRQEIQDENGVRIAKWTIARTLRAQQEIARAMEIQLALEAEIREQGLPEDGYVYEELGELYLLSNNREKAKHYFSLAYPLLAADPWLQKNESDRLDRIKQLLEED